MGDNGGTLCVCSSYTKRPIVASGGGNSEVWVYFLNDAMDSSNSVQLTNNSSQITAICVMNSMLAAGTNNRVSFVFFLCFSIPSFYRMDQLMENIWVFNFDVNLNLNELYGFLGMVHNFF